MKLKSKNGVVVEVNDRAAERLLACGFVKAEAPARRKPAAKRAAKKTEKEV